MAGNFFKGTSTEQDARFADKQKKLIRQKQWPELFDTKIDMKKIELRVIRPWLERKVQSYIGIDDEVVCEQIINFLEQNSDQFRGPDPKELQIMIQGYFERNTSAFMNDLWSLLIDAQNSQNGIPKLLLNTKREEFNQKKLELEQWEQKLLQLDAAIQECNKNNDIKNEKERKKQHQNTQYDGKNSSQLDKLDISLNIKKENLE